MAIRYQQEVDLSVKEFADVLRRSTLAERRPVDDSDRLAAMLRHANVIVTARNEQGLLVGISRALTDFAFCCYLSDLAVDTNYQRIGIGKRLVDETQRISGPKTTLILLAAPAAREYYPHIGMQYHDSCWIIRGES